MRYLLANQDYKGSLQKTHWRSSTFSKKVFGEMVTADHKVLNEEGESRNNHRYAVVVQDLATQWIQDHPCKTKTSQEPEKSLQKFLEPSQKPKVVYTDDSLEFGKSCEDLSWNHRTSTPQRSETNDIAERAVRRVEEGTSAVLLQSGLDEQWWAGSMKCYCYLRNVQDLLPDRKTPYERRLGEPLKGPIIPFGAMVEYHSISVRYQSKLQQFGKKVLPGIFLGYERIWKGDILIADIEELENSDASEIYPRRINGKEVFISQKGEEFIFPMADGTEKLFGRGYDFRESTPRWEQTVRSEDFNRELEGEPGKLNRQNRKMTLQPGPISGRFKVTSSIVITMNLEVISMCRRKKHTLFH